MDLWYTLVDRSTEPGSVGVFPGAEIIRKAFWRFFPDRKNFTRFRLLRES